MKYILSIFLISIIGCATAVEMTDYQKGVQQGLYVGLKMGQLLGQAENGNLTAAQQYNNDVDKYNAGLKTIFGNDATILANIQQLYGLPHLSIPTQASIQSSQPNYAEPRIISSGQRIHAIDASWNQTKYEPQPDAYGRVYGVPYDAWLMMGPGYDSAGNPISGNLYGNLGGA